MEKYKKYLPHLIAIGIFILISAIYCAPALSGKKLAMYDMNNTKGMSKEVMDFHKKTGQDPLWTNSMFGGMPTYQIATFTHENFIGTFFAFFQDIFPEPIDFMLFNLICFYILLITLKVDFRLAIAGSIMYTFCTYTFVFMDVGHITKSLAIAFMPLVMAGIIRTIRGDLLSGFVISLIGLWMEISSGHIQITYYLSLVIAVFLIVEFIKAIKEKVLARFFKACAVLAVATILAILPTASNLWATYEYGKQTTRGPSELSSKKGSTGLDIDYATEYSYGIGETFTLLIPNARGGGQNYDLGKNSALYQALTTNGAGAQAASFVNNAPTYWGDMPIAVGPDYVVAITVFLFIFGLFLVKGDLKWWLLTATILAIFLAWGKNFMSFTEVFFNYVPGYNKFRTVSTILTSATLTITLLGVLAVQSVVEAAKDIGQIQKKLLYAFYITGGVCLLLFLVPGLAGDFAGRSDEQFKQYDWLVNALREDRESMLRMSALSSFIYISIAFGAIWFFLKKKIKMEYMFYALILFSLVDMWTVDKHYMNDDSFISKNKSDNPFQESAADAQIKQDPALSYRVFNTAANPTTDAGTSYFHKSIGGYHGAKLKRYQELIENQISKNNMSVLNMLNTKYFIVRTKEGEPQAQMNPNALGNAWFVKEIKWVPNADSEMSALTNFNPAQTAVIDTRFEKDLSGFNITPDSTASIKLTSYAPNDLTYESSASSKQFAVLSEIYYADGWNAYVDGNKSDYVRVNYVLRGMIVPEGKHKIEFKFEPVNYYKAQTVSTAGSIIALLAIAIGSVFSLKRKKSDSSVS